MKSVLLLFLLCFITSNAISQTEETPDSIIVKANTQIYLEHIPSDTSAGYFILIEGVSDSSKIEKAIRIKFGTKPAMGSVLEIFNPYGTPFTYKAYLYNFKKKKYIDAGIHPVKPKMGVRETWPFPIEYVLIKEFKLELEKND